MIKSRAVDILRSLSHEEYKRLGKYLSSPFFTSNKNLSKLYSLLKPHHPDFENVRLTKEKIYKSIYNDTVYNDERLRKLLSEFYKELNKFLVMLGLENDELTYNRILMNKLSGKKLDSLFLKKYSESVGYINNSDFHYNNYLERYLLERDYVIFNIDNGKQHKITANIPERGNYLIFYFLSDIILTIKDIDTNRMKFGYDPEPNLPEAFLENFNIEKFFIYLNKYDFKDKEVINIFYSAFLAFRNFDDEKYYYKLHDDIFSDWDKLSKIGKFVVMSYLVNYCNNKINSGSYEFVKNLYAVYQLFIENGLYHTLEDNFIRPDILLHISDIFFKIGKIGELKFFLDKVIRIVHPDQRNNILYYFNALDDFEEKRYGESLNNISRIKSDTLLFKQRTKILLMKIYFEMCLYENAVCAAANYRNYLLKNKLISDVDKDMGRRFLNNYNYLLKLKFVNEKHGHQFDYSGKNIDENNNEIFWIKDKLKEIQAHPELSGSY